MKTFRDFIVLCISAGVLVMVLLGVLVLSLPDVASMGKCITTTMYQVKLCPGTANYAPINTISPYAIHAVIAAEDGSFYSHKGFDWHEIQASFTANLTSGKLRRGGSTLTQQLAKNVFLSKEKSFLRKLKEAYLASAIESHFKKDIILEKYLNVVEFGPNLYGIKAAANHYFGKSPGQLHPLEAAYLAHLLPNPKVYSRSARSGELTAYNKKMIKTILKRMSAFGKLSEAGYQTAMANLTGFPWAGLDKESFHGVPTYSLDAPTVNASDFDDLDEESLEEIIEESTPLSGPSDEESDME
jgi:monofunctional glycosyltransferase